MMTILSAIPPVATGRSEAKRKAMLDAATQVFVRAGYGAATMDEIAREANVSKQTIYHHFGSKEALFEAMVSDRCRAFLAPLELPANGSADMSATLERFGRTILDMALSPSSLALYRLVIGESARFPELGRISFDRGIRQAVATLARYFRGQLKLGRLRPVETEDAAERFLGLLLGHWQLRALLISESIRKDDREEWVKGAVEAFLLSHAAH